MRGLAAVWLVLAGCDALFRIDSVSGDAPRADGPLDGATGDAPKPPTIQLVQSNTLNLTTGGVLALAYAQGQHQGDLDVVIVSAQSITATITVSDTAGNTYTSLDRQTASTFEQEAFYAPDITVKAGNDIVTATFGVTVTSPTLTILEYRGIAPAAFDVSDKTQGCDSSPSASLTTTGADELLVVSAVTGSMVTATSQGYTTRPTAGQYAVIEDRIADQSAGYLASVTQAAAAEWLMLIVAFKGS